MEERRRWKKVEGVIVIHVGSSVVIEHDIEEDFPE